MKKKLTQKSIKSKIIMFCFLFFASSLLASHFRHGTISWRVVNGNTVEFKISQAWRNGCNINVGQTCYGDTFYFGDGQRRSFSVVATAVNTAENWYYGEATFTHTYANMGNFIAYFGGCCKIGSLSNNSNAYWRSETIVNVGSGNESPVTTMAPIINMQTGTTNATFQVPASDPDGDNLTYRLASYSEINGYQPSGISINQNTGLLTFNTQGRNVGSLWNASIVVEDGKTKVINDFIIKIVQQSNPPLFDYTTTPTNGFVYQVSPGVPVNFTIKADDTDPGATVSLQSIGVPPGANINLSNQNTNSISGSFSWTPTANNLGTNVINFLAQDNVGAQVSTSVTILVSLKPQFDVPPTPAEGVHNVYNPGDVISYNIQASDPDPLDIVSFTDVKGKDMMGMPIPLYNNASFNNLNGIPANPTNGIFTWATQASDWGHKHVYLYATDSYGDVTRHEISQLINTPPTFSSNPVLDADVGVAYSYTINVSDADVTYGDTISILGINLPSWLTLVDNGDGTATLTGTPSVSDVGVASINIQAEDKNHHQDPRGTINQLFDISVNNCSITIDPVNITIALDENGNATITSTPTLIDVYGEDFNTDTDGGNITSLNNWDVLAGNVDVNDFIPGNGSKELDLAGSTNSTIKSKSSINLTPGQYELSFDNKLNSNPSGGNSIQVSIGNSFSQQFASQASVTNEKVTFTVSQSENAFITLQQLGFSDAAGSFIGNFKIKKVINSYPVVTEITASCGISSVSIDKSNFDCSNVGNNTVTITATDVNGNSNSTTAIVTVNDITNPTAITQNISIDLDANGNASITPDMIDNNSSDACGIKSIELDTTSFSCANVGVNEVTLTVTDNNDNASTATANVTVNDVTNPIAITQDISIDLDANGNASITPDMIDNNSSDACGIKSIELDTTSFSCANVGVNEVTLTVTDINDNTSTATANITVNDVTNPTAITQDISIDLDANGNASITPDMIDNNSSDACGIKSIELDTTSFSCANVGVNEVTLTVTDNNDNISTATANVTVSDVNAPTVITQTATVTLANGSASITPADVDGGSFDNCSFKLSLDNNSFTCDNIGENTVTLTATDASGNTSSKTATVNVVGDLPTISINDFNAVQTQKQNTIFLGFGPQSINLTTVTNGGSGFTYEWTSNTGEIVSNEANPSINPTVSTTYDVTVTNSNGCTASTSIYVCVIDARAFDKKGRYKGKVLVCHHTNGKKGTKHVQISISKSAVMTHLTKHGVGSDHADTLGGCNAVCVDNYSARKSSKQGVTTTSIEDNLTIYPNPSRGIFDIKLTAVQMKTNIYLFDTTGKTIEHKYISEENSSENIITMGNYNLASGFYILKIVTSDETVTRKLIVEKSK